MRGLLFVIGSLAFIVALLMEFFPDRKASSIPFWIICAIAFSGLSICEYLAFILRRLDQLVLLQRKALRESRNDDDDDD